MSSEPIPNQHDTQSVVSVSLNQTHIQQMLEPQSQRIEFECSERDRQPEASMEDSNLNIGIAPSSTSPILTICSREKALANSEMAAQSQPQLAPYELSLWTDAGLQGPKLAARLKGAPNSARGLVGLCVVHRRWDVQMPKPGDPTWTSTWWLSGFVATNITSVWQAEALAVVQASKMAVIHCEQLTGVIFRGERYVSCTKRICAPVPTLVNIFSDDFKVLQSFGGVIDPNQFPKDVWLNTIAARLVKVLSRYGVRVHLQWVPGHSGDLRNEWAHEGARLALNPRLHHPKVYRKETHRVMLKVRRDRRDTQRGTTVKQETVSSSDL